MHIAQTNTRQTHKIKIESKTKGTLTGNTIAVARYDPSPGTTSKKSFVGATITFSSNRTYYTGLIGLQGAFDVESAATHELGHAIGLGDLWPATSPQWSDQTMWQLTSSNNISKRSLESGDINGALYVY